MFLRVLPSLTVLVGIALGVLSVSPDRNVLAPLLPSLVLAAVAPLAASLALSLFASGSDQVLVCTAGMLTAVGLVNLLLASLAPSQGQLFLIEIVLRQGIFIGVGFVA